MTALTPADAAVLYRDKRMSACQIAAAARITRRGAEYRIRAAGLSGLRWCPLCHTYEELRLTNAEALALLPAVQRRPKAQAEQMELPITTTRRTDA